MPLCTYDSPITSQVSNNTVNCYFSFGGEKDKIVNEASFILVPNSLDTEQSRLQFHISIDKVLDIKGKLDVFAWASFFPSHFRVVLYYRYMYCILLQSVFTIDWTGSAFVSV